MVLMLLSGSNLPFMLVKTSPKSVRCWVTGNNLAGTMVEEPG
jgi:hypothetical protein